MAPPLPLPPLPHQPPFRLVDSVLAADLPRGVLLAVRRLTQSDALWPAEQGQPAAFPQTLVIEALCQAAACLNAIERLPPETRKPRNPTIPPSVPQLADRHPTHRGYLVSLSDFKFPAAAKIGETLLLRVERKERLGALVAFAARALSSSSCNDPKSLAELAANTGSTDLPSDEAGTSSRLIASGRLLFAVSEA